MSKIDFSRVVSPDPEKAQMDRAHREQVKAICRRRITNVVDEFDQLQISCALLAFVYENKLFARIDEHPSLQRLGGHLDWISKTLSASRALMENPDLDPTSDTHWPTVPQNTGVEH